MEVEQQMHMREDEEGGRGGEGGGEEKETMSSRTSAGDERNLPSRRQKRYQEGRGMASYLLPVRVPLRGVLPFSVRPGILSRCLR